MVPLDQKINVSFQVMPVHKQSSEVIGKELDLLKIHHIQGSLEVKFSIDRKHIGTFKTAHLGQIFALQTSEIPVCSAKQVCVRGVPKLLFFHAMLVQDTSNDKTYLVEEQIDNTVELIKYINNGHPVACVQPDASEEAN